MVQLVIWPLAVTTLLIGATLADWTAPERTIGIGLLATVPVGLCFGAGLSSGSLLLVGTAIGAAKCVGVFTMAAMARWLCQLFPVRIRYSGVAVALAIGTTVGQGLTPVVAQMIVVSTSMVYVGVLPAALALVAFASMRLAYRADGSRELSLAAAASQ